MWKIIFSPINYLCSFVKDKLITFVWVYYWDIYSVPLICLSIFSPKSQCLNYCSFIVVWKMDSVSIQNCFFSPSILDCCPLPLPINFTISFSVTKEQLAGIWIWYYWIYRSSWEELTFLPYCVFLSMNIEYISIL